ncbi:MAG TPA: ABC transporter ATP-binding protein [Thermoanaerobaculia bacterium]|nr:ABC transporter ATP-binding protein [Thermoanaerobaculia bacterium]
MEPIFAVENLTRRFGGLTALDSIGFSVERGSIFSIIGPNGAGKSTLFNCICGVYRPDRGRVLFEGREITAQKPHRIARHGIGRTFQNLELFRNMTTMENLMLGRHLHMRSGVWSGAMMFRRLSRAGMEEVEHRERVEHIIDLLALHAARDRFIWQLPYGTQKLIELGRALAAEPRLLLLDEPAAGMNLEERHDLIFWIRDIRDELGVTIVMIEHNMQMVMGISDRVLALDFGRTITEGTPQEVAEHPEVVRAYLG